MRAIRMSGMRHLSIFIVFLTCIIPCLGQRGFYRTDSVMIAGADLVSAGRSNSYFCSVKKGDSVARYTPYEVHSYGFDHGPSYEAFDITNDGRKERYFLEHLVRGKINLYCLRLKGGTIKYYILPDGDTVLTELYLSKDEVRDRIGSLIDDCLGAVQNLKYLKPEKHSLKRYLNDLNSCSVYPYPKVYYGVKVGIAATQFYPVDKSSLYSIPDYKSDIGYTIGAFIDIPLFSGDLSFAPEINFNRIHYSRSFNYKTAGFDLVMNYSRADFPLLFKYRFLRNGNIPFIELGPVYSQVVRNKAVLYKYETFDNEIFIGVNDDPVIRKNMGGFSLGSGIISGSGKKYKWFGGVRYSHLFYSGSIQKQFNFGQISINTGILFNR